MKKKVLKKKLAKTEKKLNKLRTELRHTKDRLNESIAGQEPVILEEKTAPEETVVERLEKFMHP
ncbi:MAG: hypothetical protein ACJ73D_02380 [Pyrinomonadaceae bacterium]